MTLRGMKRAHEASDRHHLPPAESATPDPPASPVVTKRRRGLDSETPMEWTPERETPSASSCTVKNPSTSASLFMKHFLVDSPVELCHTFSGRTKFDNHKCKLVGITFTPNGDVVISDAENKKVKVFSPSGGLKVECTVPWNYSCGLIEPNGVVVLESGEIITCDRRAGNLKVFTAQGKCLTTIGRSLIRPTGLAVTSTSAIVITDEAKKDVLIYRSISDRKPLSLQRLNAEKLDLQSPSSVCVTSSDEIVVFDAGFKKFFLFDKEGKLSCDNLIPKEELSQLMKTKQNKPIKLNQNLSLCKGPDGSVLIGHSAMGGVMQYDIASRKVRRHIMENNNMSSRPSALATDIQGYLGVIEEDCETLKIFRYMR